MISLRAEKDGDFIVTHGSVLQSIIGKDFKAAQGLMGVHVVLEVLLYHHII